MFLLANRAVLPLQEACSVAWFWQNIKIQLMSLQNQKLIPQSYSSLPCA